MAPPAPARLLGLGAALGALLAPLSACGPARPDAPQSVLLVVVDTLRRDHVGAYGGAVATPEIDALAARGQLYGNAVASFHQTSMSMAAMFTGRTPSIESGDPREPLAWTSASWCGMARFSAGRQGETCIPGGVPTLAEQLAGAGWHTMGVASNQFLYEPSGFGRGFADWTEVDRRKPVAGAASRRDVPNARESRYWPVVNAAALAAVERAPAGKRFLYVHYIDVHDYRFKERSYAESVAVLDAAFGELSKGLRERGFLDDAAIVFTSDHGERLGEDHAFPGELPNIHGHYGNPSFDEVLRIPLIVAPALADDPARLVRTQDLHDLVLRVAGLTPAGTRDVESDEVFVGELLFRTYRKGTWKTIFRRGDGRAFLYDLAADPTEQHDLAEAKPLLVLAHRMRANALTAALEAAPAARTELSEEEKETLRSLGYLDDAPPSDQDAE